MKRLAALFIVGLFTSANAAEPYDSWRPTIEKLDLHETLDLILKLERRKKTLIADIHTRAKKGDGRAQFTLGQYYYIGYHVKKDRRATIHWMKKSAANGNRRANLFLKEYFPGE